MPVKRILIPEVSIQLVSPASGEAFRNRSLFTCQLDGFHSISFPSEWGGLLLLAQYWESKNSRVSIQLVSPASGESLG